MIRFFGWDNDNTVYKSVALLDKIYVRSKGVKSYARKI